MTKVLRPVPTFEQVIRQPAPQLQKPDRVIEVSKPDPNLFEYHMGVMGDQQQLMALHAIHDAMMRGAAQRHGADIGVMRDLQHTAMELNRTLQAEA